MGLNSSSETHILTRVDADCRRCRCHDAAISLYGKDCFLLSCLSKREGPASPAVSQAEMTSAISELQPDAHPTAGLMAIRSIPDLNRGRQSIGLPDPTAGSRRSSTDQPSDRSFAGRSEPAGPAFVLPVGSGRLFAFPDGFSLKSGHLLPVAGWSLFPVRIGSDRGLLEKSPGLTADRRLSEFLPGSGGCRLRWLLSVSFLSEKLTISPASWLFTGKITDFLITCSRFVSGCIERSLLVIDHYVTSTRNPI